MALEAALFAILTPLVATKGTGVTVATGSMPSLEYLDLALPPAPARKESSPSWAQQESLPSCFEYDTDLYGYDMASPVFEPSAAACQSHCQQVPGCQFFTWTSEGGACYVKSSDASRQKKTGATSGPRGCQAAASAGGAVVESLPGGGELESMPLDEDLAMPSMDQLGLGANLGANVLSGGNNQRQGSGEMQWVDVPSVPGGGSMDLESMPIVVPDVEIPTTTLKPTPMPTPAPTPESRSSVDPGWVTTTRSVQPLTLRSTTATTTSDDVSPSDTETSEPPRILTLQPLPDPTLEPDKTDELTQVPQTSVAPLSTSSIPDSSNPDVDPGKCNLNCYGEGVCTPVPLVQNDVEDPAVPVKSDEDCRKLCKNTEGCEAIVFDGQSCWGRKDIFLAKCQQGENKYVTEFVTKNQIGTCAILGDPHILTFDNAQGYIEDVTQLHYGHYHIVDAPSAGLKIQGRFGFTKRFPSASSLVGIAVGGTYIGGNKLIAVWIGPDEGVPGMRVLWNGQQILKKGISADTFSDGPLEAECNKMDPVKFHQSARHTYGGSDADGDMPSYLFKFKPDLEIYLLIGEDAMNAVITMRKVKGKQDGYCGNFNCDPEDDTLPELEKRQYKGPCEAEDSLFRSAPEGPRNQSHAKGLIPSLENCDPDVLKQAKVNCASAGRMKNACILDTCAANMPAVDVQEEDEVGNGFRLTGIISVPAWVQVALTITLVGLFIAGVAVGLPCRRRRHRLYDELSLFDENTERDSSRTVRMSFAGDSGSGALGIPILNRLRDSAASALAVTHSASALPTGFEDEEALLQPVADEHDAI